MSDAILPGMIDSHAHLLHIARKELDVSTILQQCFDAGMAGMIDIGVDLEHHAEREELSSRFPNVARAEGLYPSVAEAENLDEQLAELERSLAADRVVAVGEIGLDYHRDYATRAQQQDLFRRQIEIASNHSLPVVIHNRDADGDVLSALRSTSGTIRGVMHCFSGDVSFARSCLDEGLFISFAGNVTFKNASDLREIARFVPFDRLLLETDAPYLTPHPLRGRPNHPGLIGHTYTRVATERKIDLSDLIETVRSNFNRLFNTEF